MPGRNIGLLGGSFNPCHDGHLHISRQAIKRLGLDEVWWLVSPGNPLKPRHGMAPLAQRLSQAKRFVTERRIKVSDIERRLGTVYTIDTIRALKRQNPRDQFVWIMGADNLQQLPRWQRWDELFKLVCIAIFDRPAYALRALSGKAAQRFGKSRIEESQARALIRFGPPRWIFLHDRLHNASATRIRERISSQNVDDGTNKGPST